MSHCEYARDDAMTGMIILGKGGAIAISRIVAVFPAKSAPIKRLIEAAGPRYVINMTYGYPRQAAILLDNGYIVITSQTVADLAQVLPVVKRMKDVEKPSWW